MEKHSSQERRYPEVGIYEHYKSTPEAKKYYQVLGFARHTESEETLVVYVPLYVDDGHQGLRMQARPLDIFIENVELDGETVPRFRYAGPEL